MRYWFAVPSVLLTLSLGCAPTVNTRPLSQESPRAERSHSSPRQAKSEKTGDQPAPEGEDEEEQSAEAQQAALESPADGDEEKASTNPEDRFFLKDDRKLQVGDQLRVKIAGNIEGQLSTSEADGLGTFSAEGQYHYDMDVLAVEDGKPIEARVTYGQKQANLNADIADDRREESKDSVLSGNTYLIRKAGDQLKLSTGGGGRVSVEEETELNEDFGGWLKEEGDDDEFDLFPEEGLLAGESVSVDEKDVEKWVGDGVPFEIQGKLTYEGTVERKDGRRLAEFEFEGHTDGDVDGFQVEVRLSGEVDFDVTQGFPSVIYLEIQLEVEAADATGTINFEASGEANGEFGLL